MSDYNCKHANLKLVKKHLHRFVFQWETWKAANGRARGIDAKTFLKVNVSCYKSRLFEIWLKTVWGSWNEWKLIAEQCGVGLSG